MSKPKLRPFVGFDGEGIGRGRAHRYAVMTCSSSERTLSVVNPEGFSTADCVGFLRTCKETFPDALFVGFGLNYDAGMMLRDLALDELERLWDSGYVVVELAGVSYELEYVPGRLLSIRELPELDVDTMADFAELELAPPFSIRITDVLGFVQCTFVEALQRFQLDTPKLVKQGKRRRGRFGLADVAFCRDYCGAETRALAELAERLRHDLHEHGLRPAGWYGAGAVASGLCRAANVKLHRPEDEHRSLAITEALLRAYHGGRTETFRQGEFARATRYDLRSAYGWALMGLPTAKGTWKRRREYHPDEPWALWRVRWAVEGPNAGESLLCPFPFRHDHRTTYPLEGEGWYHASEVAAAMRVFPGQVHVTSGYVFEPASDVRPFQFLEALYDLRAELELAGDPIAGTLKLALAAVWGKTAQANQRRFRRRAAYRDWFWAGAATAAVRGQMLEVAAMAGERRLLSISTDALLVRGVPTLTVSNEGPGSWAVSGLEDLLLIDATTYCGLDVETGAELAAAAGFARRDLDYDVMRAAWRHEQQWGRVALEGERFVGIGSAVLEGLAARLGTWRPWPQELSFYSPGKFYDEGERGPRVRTIYPPGRQRAGLSAPFEPNRGSSTLPAPDVAEWREGTDEDELELELVRRAIDELPVDG